MADERRLGRHVEHDERSRAWAVEQAAGRLRSVLHRHGPVLHQRKLGSCVGHALVHALNTTPLHRSGRPYLDHQDALTAYRLATTLDDIPGSWPPDDTGSSGLAGCKAAKELGWITSYRHCFSVDAMLTALQTTPVMVGTPWYYSMNVPDRTGLVSVGGRVQGGHEWMAYGWTRSTDLVHAVSSWGVGWGRRGEFDIRREDLARLLAEDGDCTVPVRQARSALPR